VRENPTKLEYILRCFLKVKAICKNKNKMLRLRRRRECALKNTVCSPYPGKYY